MTNHRAWPSSSTSLFNFSSCLLSLLDGQLWWLRTMEPQTDEAASFPLSGPRRGFFILFWHTAGAPVQPVCPAEMSHEPFWAMGAQMKEPGPKHCTANCYFFSFWPHVSLFGQKLILINLYQLPEVGLPSLRFFLKFVLPHFWCTANQGCPEGWLGRESEQI